MVIKKEEKNEEIKKRKRRNAVRKMTMKIIGNNIGDEWKEVVKLAWGSRKGDVYVWDWDIKDEDDETEY